MATKSGSGSSSPFGSGGGGGGGGGANPPYDDRDQKSGGDGTVNPKDAISGGTPPAAAPEGGRTSPVGLPSGGKVPFRVKG